MRSPTKHRSAPAWLPLAAAMILGACGGQGAGASVKIVYGDGGAPPADAAPDGAPVDVGPSYCCVLQLPDGSAGGAGNCASLVRGGLGVSEPCLTGQDGGGTYGLWTCGAGAAQTECSDRGLSCGLGEPCTLVDVGCAGVVERCDAPAADAGTSRG